MPLKNTNAIHPLDWPIHNVLAFTTTRHSPEPASPDFSSAAPFNQFNLGLHVGDDATQVEKNRQQLLNYLPSNTKIQWLEQVHGHHVHLAKTYSPTPIIADAQYSQTKNLALAIMTADCLPILLASHNGKEIAAIHGGWRPLVQNIIAKTLSCFSTQPEQITAWLGPCIGDEVFEVGADVYQAFVQCDAIFEQAFKLISPSQTINKATAKYLANLALLATIQLQQLGIKNIINQSVCTYSNPADFFSYRRENITGRMASIICCK